LFYIYLFINVNPD